MGLMLVSMAVTRFLTTRMIETYCQAEVLAEYMKRPSPVKLHTAQQAYTSTSS